MASTWSFDFHARRRLKNQAMLVLSCVVAVAGLGLPIWILYTAIARGIDTFNMAIFTQMTPPPDAAGGLLNAIIGSLMMVGLATLAAS
ncbi:MAG TPA: hypothetical protein VFM32_09545, partial [Spongiibacteraceae bacterium]|nr:hypothetical protein [Spongiibacteraceae bacterium]